MSNDKEWHILPDETYTGAVTFKHDYYDMKISVKWDGCSNFSITEDDEECDHHICYFSQFVEALQALNGLTLNYFGGEYSMAPINEDERAHKIAERQREEKTVDGSVEIEAQSIGRIINDPNMFDTAYKPNKELSWQLLESVKPRPRLEIMDNERE
jgi:hypothetical protein